MSTYERETRVSAPLGDVWRFHVTTGGLEALTPDWLGLRVEAAIGPDGDANPDVLATGTEIDLSVRPFGVGPRRRWTSLIVDCERTADGAYFRDEMIAGPFETWIHTHSFFADGDETILRDAVEYALPLGGLGDALEPLSWIGFEPTFRYRHRTATDLLEGRPTG